MIRIVLFLIFFAAFNIKAQIYSGADIEITREKFEYLTSRNLAEASFNEIIVETGKCFINTEYKNSPLERGSREQLVIDLKGFDCSTYLENVLAVSRAFRMGKKSFHSYYSELLKIRYRDGLIQGYESRLHYFSDWIYNNSNMDIIKDVTKEIGGEPYKIFANYMSANSHAYKYLRENPEIIPVIEEQELEISQRLYYFIPKERVSEIENKICNGDLLAFTSGIDGLDINHVGIAVKEDDGPVYLLHASKEEGKVIISGDSLSEYILKIKNHTGLIVLRPVEPYNL